MLITFNFILFQTSAFIDLISGKYVWELFGGFHGF